MGQPVNRHYLLQALEQQLVLLAQSISATENKPLFYSRFDRKFFQSHGKRMRNYLNEAEQNFHTLRHLIKESRTDRVAFMTEKIIS
ncbi:MAG: primosomal replication protein PriC [Candidatus Malihini olakiniferum]